MNDNKQVSLYDFKGHQVRVVELEGNPWFVAADVCDCLALGGYPSGHTAALPADEKLVLSRSLNSRLELFGPKQPAISMVSESGLYKLVLRSRKPDAQDFKHWVTSEVLPSIRKNGGYVKGQEKIDPSDDTALDRMTKLVLEGLQKKAERLEKERVSMPR